MANGSGRLADRLLRRRSELTLSIRRAATLAGVHRRTWAAWESGVIPHVKHQARIEQVVGWNAGSAQRAIDGGEPELAREAPGAAPDPYVDPLTLERYQDQVEMGLWDLRRAFAQRYVRELGPERARELGEERAREHIRLYRLQTGNTRRVA